MLSPELIGRLVPGFFICDRREDSTILSLFGGPRSQGIGGWLLER